MHLTCLKADRIRTVVHSFVLVLLFTGCSSRSLVDHPSTSATLWVQNAVEYKAICYQTYQIATTKLDMILAEKAESSIETRYKKYAIITDVDETVLDNSPFQARMILKNRDYNPDDWKQWVSEAGADAIPGAAEFMNYAASNGIEIYYITNREADTESYTRNNLIELGFPVKSDKDVILTKNEKTEWTSSKMNRRALVEEEYEVLMIFGDDLNDFYDAKGISDMQRNDIVTNNMDKWGNSWFMLPNPVYGSWEQSLFGIKRGLSETEKEAIILNSLNTKKQ